MNKKLDIVIIGGGIAGVMCLLQINKHVTLFNKTINNKDSLLKRVLVSGNGRCNFFNNEIKKDIKYKKEIEDLFTFFKENSFAYYIDNKGLYYPFFNRSECFYNFLKTMLAQKDYDYIEEEIIKVDYKNKIIYSNNDSYSYNKLIIATGGRSYDRNDFNYDLIKSLEIDYYPFKPSLVPVKTIEKIDKKLINNKIKCNVELLSNNKIIYTEDGEVLFKNDGLSGICIFNMTKYINDLIRNNINDIKIKLNILNHNNTRYNYDLVKNSLPLFLKDIKLINNEYLLYSFKDFHSFENSQVSYGGIINDEINSNYMLIKRKDIYVIGEIIDNNYICGGYNIGYALLEGFKLGRYINEIK